MKTTFKYYLLVIGLLSMSFKVAAQQEATVCTEGVGVWAFTSGVGFELQRGGNLVQNKAVVGTWKCDPENGKLRLLWNTGDVKDFTFSADSETLFVRTGDGMYDYEIAANKVAQSKEGPADLMDKSKSGQSTDAMDLGKQGSQPKTKTPKKGTGGGVKGN
jgi:hypothetical protein